MTDAPEPRFPPLDEAEMSAEQRAAWETIEGFALDARGGHFNAMLRMPEAAGPLMRLGQYLRFETGLPDRLLELAILTHARMRSDAYEWRVHRPRALEQGWTEAQVAALADGKRPEGLSEAEGAAFDLCLALGLRNRVTDAEFARAKAALGEQAIAQLALLLGNYAIVSGLLAAAGVEPPDGAKGALQPMARPFEG